MAEEFEKEVACDESILLPKLRDLLIEEHGAKLKAGYSFFFCTFFCPFIVSCCILLDKVRDLLIEEHGAKLKAG